MRDIKFRAWYKEGQEMLAVRDINFCGEEIDTYEMQGDWIGFEYLELMQYTGLKDKNGKEIYEGDIIRHDWGLNKITFEDYSFTAEHIISFDGAYNCNLYLSEIGSDCEVIGNIYENPELLKEESV